jgi:RNA polymerase sigma-70 factor (ECF subfamily)
MRRRDVRARADRRLREVAAPAPPPGPEAVAISAELRGRFERAVALLPEGQRTVFLLRHEGGLTLAEVAETLGLQLSTVKTQFARACLKLQSILSAFRPETRSGT